MKTFRDRVYTLAARIPRGKVLTYGALARLAGNPKAARAVGAAMRSNSDTKKVPCHRVVASDGSLAGYAFGGLTAKRRRLEKEGVLFLGDKVDLSKSEWRTNKRP